MSDDERLEELKNRDDYPTGLSEEEFKEVEDLETAAAEQRGSESDSGSDSSSESDG